MAEERKFYSTKEGLERLKKEYEFLKVMRLAKTTGEAPKILESEDLNPEYLSFQQDLNLLETKIKDLENVLKNAVLIAPPGSDKKDIVMPGAKVTVEIDETETDEFQIVGTFEANPGLGRISNESPVGRALLGHKAGEQISISSPIKTIYKIKKIRY